MLAELLLVDVMDHANHGHTRREQRRKERDPIGAVNDYVEIPSNEATPGEVDSGGDVDAKRSADSPYNVAVALFSGRHAVMARREELD